MKIHPVCNNSKTFTGIKPNQLIDTIGKNFSVDMKSLSKDIVEKGAKVADKKNDIYLLKSAETSNVLEIVMIKAKNLISRVRLFSGEKCIEEISYDYNKKGDIIRVLKKNSSQNGKESACSANLKYVDNGLVVTKRFDDGSTIVTEFLNKEAPEIKLEKTFRESNQVFKENIEYIEGQKLNSVTRNSAGEVYGEAYADELTGEMIFARDNTKHYEEFTELMADGDYHRQLCFEHSVIVHKISSPRIANHFFHFAKDLMTPLNELSTKLKEYLV